MPNVFAPAVSEALIARLGRLSADDAPEWGSMTAAQMLAHCSKPYESVYEAAYTEAYPRPNAILRVVLRLLAKPIVVGPRPYRRNMRTAPAFLVEGDRDFGAERDRLVGYIERTQALGADHFDGLESHSFGPLTEAEWSQLFWKHLDHHLTQFGV